MAAASSLPKLLDLCGKFVNEHGGNWNHQDWEKLLDDATKLGYALEGDEARRNLGNVLEAAKYFYGDGADSTGSAVASKAPARKKAPAKKKATSD